MIPFIIILRMKCELYRSGTEEHDWDDSLLEFYLKAVFHHPFQVSQGAEVLSPG